MTVPVPSLDELRLALRVDGTALDGEINRLVAVARAFADRQLRGATVPDEIAKHAVTLFIAWAFEAPVEIGASAAGTWRRCGAESVLKPWTVRHAAAVAAPDGD